MSEPPIKQEEIIMEEVSSDGDIILIVGLEKKRIRVNSAFLRIASRVLDSMFGPNWAEGQNLSSAAPKDVPLEDDDFDALLVICNLIHHRIGSVPDTLTPLKVFRIAVTADKYDCVPILKYVSKDWLKVGDCKNFLDLARLMMAAYLLGNPTAFKENSAQLILRSTGSFVALLNDEEIFAHLNPEVILKLEEHRSTQRAALISLLDSWTATDEQHGDTLCLDWDEIWIKRVAKYRRALKKAELYAPGTVKSLEDILQALDGLAYPQVPCNCSRSYGHGLEATALRQRLSRDPKEYLQNWKDGVGLSLEFIWTLTV